MGGHLLNVLANHAILAECAPPGQSGEFYFAIFGEFIFAIDNVCRHRSAPGGLRRLAAPNGSGRAGRAELGAGRAEFTLKTCWSGPRRIEFGA